jgi:hypothetical protein
LESLLKCSRMDDDSNMSEPNRLLIDESVSSSAPASPSCSSQQQPKMAAVIPKTTRKGHRITQFIEDKTLRVRSYFRRRHIPFKRAFELDLQCGTQSLLLQIDEDIEECLYYGHDKLVEQFLSNEGINLAHANNIIVEGIYSFILNKERNCCNDLLLLQRSKSSADLPLKIPRSWNFLEEERIDENQVQWG